MEPVMELLFERSKPGRQAEFLPKLDVDLQEVPADISRTEAPRLPEIAEIDITRHYSELVRATHGVNDGIYMLGSCTMKYNPHMNEHVAALPGFTQVHPLQPVSTAQGALEMMLEAEELFCEITGMDAMTFQPAAGAHGELLGIYLIKAYHEARGQTNRTRIFVPDAAHGTNPATAAMAAMDVVSIPTFDDGEIDVEALRALMDDNVAGLMLTNPNTEGLFAEAITDITSVIHEAGGLCYYDGANLNPIMGIVRPGDMGFDVIHLNLHKTFSTPHGGGGPGSGAVGVKDVLVPYLPECHPVRNEDGTAGFYSGEESIGRIKANYGNFLVVLRAFAYVLTLGCEGIKKAAEGATLNANYLMAKLRDTYTMSTDGTCMHEFVMNLSDLKKETGVSALDVAKGILDYGVHPPTMYFPLTVPEALMVEPTETESKETLDRVVEIFLELHAKAHEDPEYLHEAPHTTIVRRPDEVGAARNPVTRYDFSALDASDAE